MFSSKNTCRNNLFAHVHICLISGSFMHANGCKWSFKNATNVVGNVNTSLPLTNSSSAFSCCRLRFGTPNVKHTPETTKSLVALARDFLPPSSVNGRSLAIKLLQAQEEPAT